ncbi:MAG TPA: DUF4132 domain-containing protein [Candidatus Obscuribacterales bacterium]
MPEAPTLRLECSEAGASKFWQIHQLEGEVTINWGRIGTAGQTQIKQFTSAAEAEAFRDTQAAAKRKKGYIDATGQQVTFPIGEPAPRSKKAANSKKVQPQDPKAPPSPKTISSAAEGKVLWSARQRATRLRFVNDDIGFSSDKTSEIYRHFRDMPFLPPPADAAAARAILRPRLRLALLELKNSFPPELAEALSGLRHLALPDRPTEALSLEAAAVGLSLMPTYDQSLMDWLILAQGPSFAVEALLASLHYPTEHRYSGARISYAAEASAFYLYRIGFACLTLHRWLRELPCEDAAYRQAWERAGELRPELGGIGRVLLAFLFSRETDGLEAAVREWLDLDINGLPTYRTVPGGGAMNMIMTGTVGHWNSGWLLWPLVAKAELQAGFSARWLKESEHEQNIILDFLCEWSGWALECLGEAAAGLLAFLTAHGRKSEQRKAGAELLALIHSPRAHAEMARLLTTREGQKYFPEPLRRTPAWSIPALLAAVLAQPRQAEPRRQLEHLLALAEPELLAGLSLSPDQAALLASLQSAAPASQPVAGSEDLPELLRLPPWERVRPQASPALLELTPPAKRRQIEWRPEDENSGAPRLPSGATPPVPVPAYALELSSEDEAAIAKFRHPVWRAHVYDLDKLSPAAALHVFNACLQLSPQMTYPPGPQPGFKGWDPDVSSDCFMRLLRRLGTDALPGMIALAWASPGQNFQHLTCVVSPRLAFTMAKGLELAKVRSLCWAWLNRHRQDTALGLIPIALSPQDPHQTWAAQFLRRLGLQGWGETLRSAAANYGPAAAAALEQLLAADPLLDLPAKAPALPDFCQAALLSAPILHSGQVLPEPAVVTAVRLLMLSPFPLPHAGLLELKKLCTPASLAEFAWSLTRLWLDQGAPGKQEWMFLALGYLGDENGVTRLAPLIEKWPGEHAHTRALAGLEVLLMINSQHSLLAIQRLAQKSRFPALKEAAQQRLQEAAQLRGLSLEALMDQLVPDFGFDACHRRSYVLAGQPWQVIIDAQLKLQLEDAQGQVLAKLPKTTPKDEEKAWKQLKKQVEAVLSLQAQRLETAMCNGQSWAKADFEACLLHHPLLGQLVKSLLWSRIRQGEEDLIFQISPDGSWRDCDGQLVTATAADRLSVAHPLHFYPERELWRTRMQAEAQPFEQLARAVYFAGPEDFARLEPARFGGRSVPGGALVGLLKQRNWKKDGEGSLSKPFGAFQVSVTCDYANWAVGMFDKVGIYSLEITNHKFQKVPPAALDPISFSELLRDLAWLDT